MKKLIVTYIRNSNILLEIVTSIYNHIVQYTPIILIITTGYELTVLLTLLSTQCSLHRDNRNPTILKIPIKRKK